MQSTPKQAILALYAALESGQHGDALRPLLTEDAVFTEHPNLVKPHGSRAELAQIAASSAHGAKLLAWQRYQVRDAIEHGDLAITRVTWTAELARDAGPFRAGQQLAAHIAQFVTCRDGRICHLETYDCYEPLKP